MKMIYSLLLVISGFLSAPLAIAQHLNGTWEITGMVIEDPNGNWLPFSEISISRNLYEWNEETWEAQLLLMGNEESRTYFGKYREVSYQMNDEGLLDRTYWEMDVLLCGMSESYTLDFRWCSIGVDCDQFAMERIDHDTDLPRYRYRYERVK